MLCVHVNNADVLDGQWRRDSGTESSAVATKSRKCIDTGLPEYINLWQIESHLPMYHSGSTYRKNVEKFHLFQRIHKISVDISGFANVWL